MEADAKYRMEVRLREVLTEQSARASIRLSPDGNHGRTQVAFLLGVIAACDILAANDGLIAPSKINELAAALLKT